MEDERVLRVAFRNILKMGNKANTYKFALAKFLLEYSNKFTHDELKLAVKTKKSFDVQYSEIAEFFLKFYWHQECKYRIQHSDPKYTPNVIQSIRKFFGTKYISKTMDKVENSKEKTLKKRFFHRILGGSLRRTLDAGKFTVALGVDCII